MAESYPKKKEIDGHKYEKYFTGSSKAVDDFIESHQVTEKYYYRTFKDGHKRHLYLRPKLNR